MNSTVKNFYDFAPYPLKSVLATLNGLRLNWWRGAVSDSLRDELWTRRKWSREQWASWQRAQLSIMLRHAAESVPYYRNIWRNRSGSIVNLEDWPILTKSEIRANPSLFISDKFRGKRLFTVTSSGTSGTPMHYFFDRASLSHWYALIDSRLHRSNGLSRGAKWANIGGQLVAPVSRRKPPFWVWNSAMNQLYLSSYHLNPEFIRFYADALLDYGIEYVYGYASSLYTLSRHCLESGIRLPRMKVAITNAEPLLDYQRAVVEEAFECRAVQTYGGSEFAFGGCECVKGTMHVWEDAGYVEVFKLNANEICSPGEVGRFIVTGLINNAMPLIRYEMGDAGALMKFPAVCECGTDTSVFKRIEGRNDDLIITKSGTRIGRLDPVFKSNIKIREAQIIQLSRDELEVRVNPGLGYGHEDEDSIRKRLVERVGEMRIRFVIDQNIARGPNGKFKAVVSHVK